MAPFLSLLIPSRVRSREAVDPPTLGRRSLPEAKAPEKGACVVAGAAAWRQRIELVDVAAAEDDVLRLERGDEAGDDGLAVPPPFGGPLRPPPREPRPLPPPPPPPPPRAPPPPPP